MGIWTCEYWLDSHDSHLVGHSVRSLFFFANFFITLNDSGLISSCGRKSRFVKFLYLYIDSIFNAFNSN